MKIISEAQMKMLGKTETYLQVKKKNLKKIN